MYDTPLRRGAAVAACLFTLSFSGCGDAGTGATEPGPTGDAGGATTSDTGGQAVTGGGSTTSDAGDGAGDAGGATTAPPACVDDAGCDDANPCTTDTCDPAAGCQHTANDAACDDGVSCTADTCDLALGCVATPDDALCDDASVCTVDTCDLAADCTHAPAELDCDDGVPCTDDACDPGLGCVSTPNDDACDDADACTTDTCDPAADCTHAPAELDCDDGVPCTDDACDPGLGCVSTPNDLGCDDANPCTDDLCTTLGCDHPPSTAPCDDGDPCTGPDACQAGACTGPLVDGCFYLEAPNLPGCVPGVLSPARKLQALDDLNHIRSLSGLAPVTYYWEGDAQTQASSLVMVANSSLSHEPPESWACWSQAAADGAISSNLYIQWQWDPMHYVPWKSMVSWLIDTGVPSLGHRRWMLDPFLSQISYGAVDGPTQVSSNYPQAFASSLQVIHDDKADLSDTDLTWVAYPVGEYPADLFDTSWYLSFSWLVDPLERYANSLVDLSNVTVSVTDPGGAPLPVLDLTTNNSWMGLPNNVQWRVDGLVEGVSYTIHVSGGSYDEGALETTYTFTLL